MLAREEEVDVEVRGENTNLLYICRTFVEASS